MVERTPVIIGVGEASERIDAEDYAGLSPVALAAKAAEAAMQDAGASHPLASSIDVIAAIRQFEISGPHAEAPFGRSNNFPRSVARRIGADPRRAILEPVGGQGPQHLVNELAHTIGRGDADLALILGAEAISTVRHLLGKGERRDWAEDVQGDLEDRGFGLEGLLTADLAQHGARAPIHLYALFENARRAKRGLDPDAYRQEMGRLFAPFTKIAAQNPHAMSQAIFDTDDLARVTAQNRMIADPHPRRMVARDQANQAAAVVIASTEKAKALGVPQDQWVYLHGGADTAERTPMQRADLSAYPAAGLASRRALEAAGLTARDIEVFDFYSCFPVAVFAVLDELQMSCDDARPLTVTGGLPFFGGAGNNYSMHAIASMIRKLRQTPGAFGFVGANGGFLSKYSTGVYSTAARPWTPFQSADLQKLIDSWASPPLAADDVDEGSIETYTIDHGRDPMTGTLICRTPPGARFVAMTDPADPKVVTEMTRNDPLGARVFCRRDAKNRRIVRHLTPSA